MSLSPAVGRCSQSARGRGSPHNLTTRMLRTESQPVRSESGTRGPIQAPRERGSRSHDPDLRLRVPRTIPRVRLCEQRRPWPRPRPTTTCPDNHTWPYLAEASTGRRVMPRDVMLWYFGQAVGIRGTRWHHDAMNDRPYRTAAEVALELGVSLRTVRRWVADGRLRATRVGRSVRIPVDAYRETSLPSSPGAVSGIEGRSPASRWVGEVAADYAAGRVAATWPETPERLAEQRRHASALMDRLAARGRPPSGLSDTADAILDTVRAEFGAAGALPLPGAELARRPTSGRLGRRPTR